MHGRIQDLCSRHWRTALAAVLLLGLTVWLFWPATGFGFIAFDDGVYVFENPRVLTGLSWRNVRWAFGTVHEQYWLPVLWISYMANAALLGPEPWGFHLVNILLHACNVLLVFYLLLRTTGQRWPAALVAGLFAVHPLNVEAVVWITARKDTLSSLFWLLGLLAYVRHAERPSPGRYAPVPVLMTLGLMCKAVVVAMPFTLMLLDYWPLRRAWSWRRFLAEKGPLFGLAAVFVALNLTTHTSGTGAAAGLPWATRLALIPANYTAYLGRLLAPVRLGILHPENDVVRWGATASAAAGLALFTWAAAVRRDRWPFLVTGWGWFLVTLLPVIRGVRLGLSAVADRYTYMAGIGIFLLIAWAGTALVRAFPRWKPAAIGVAVAALAACASLARAQVGVWSSPEKLFEQALTRGEHVVSLGHLATLRDGAGRTEEAIALYERALELAPDHPDTHNNIARLYARTGRAEEALRHYRRALDLRPAFPGVLNNLGLLYESRGDLAAAASCLEQALQLDPHNYLVHNNLGTVYARSGRMREAAARFARALELAPHRADVRANYERAMRRLNADADR